jgi:nucleotide-binding universal stress UspA family protein
MPPVPPVIVVALDFSDTSIEALAFACEVARARDARLHLLHVVADARLQAWSLDAPGLDLEAFNREALATAKRLLDAVAVEGVPDERVTRSVVFGIPDLEICRYAVEQQASMVVLGTHGYGPVRRFLLGSVATRVVRHAPCPVVTVPHRAIRAEAAAPEMTPQAS